ncbi:YybH family protein [Myroides indicus]|uniref:Ketosteroid isomerase-like protein n=1 Tax=Myroides indicus TaxID=1323422 RepID=A0A4R7F5Z8_9FLAO|nr:nuclear transport factor 2 family protein [Myroides indicus]TDS66133.1 ketosteroid isomerase-like protein [Myroides indicus]
MKKALHPQDITELFLEYINSGNIDNLVSLYEDDAVLVIENDTIAQGKEEIKKFYATLVSNNPKFEKGIQRRPLINKDIALTSSRLINGVVTAEVARKQPDGTWKWFIDQPVIAKE